MLQLKINNNNIINGQILKSKDFDGSITFSTFPIDLYKGYYSLILRTVDENGKDFIHYYKNNILDINLETGNQILSYIKPDIKIGKGYQRYIFQLWKQPKKMGLNLISRNIDIDKFFGSKRFLMYEEVVIFVENVSCEMEI